MDFKVLKYFIAVAEELNFTRAAEKLHISQPPLSTQIQNLESDLGTKLFIRSNHGLQLTDSGKLLLDRAKQIIAIGEHTKEDIKNLEEDLKSKKS